MQPTPPSAPPSVQSGLRVLHIVPAALHSRFGRMFRQLGFALGETGVRLALASDDPRLLSDIDTTPVAGVRLRGISGWRALRAAGEIERGLDEPPHAVHLWGLAAWYAVRGWLRRGRIPALIHLCSREEVQRAARARFDALDVVAVLCGDHGRLLRELRPPLGAACQVLEPALLTSQPRAAVVGPLHTLGVLWLGSVEGRAEQSLLLDTIAALRGGHDVQFLLPACGDRAWRVLRRRGVLDCVTALADPLLWDRTFPGIDACVVPRREEAPSLAPLLAMSLGKPVISAADQPAAWFVPGETTATFDAGDAAALAGELRGVIERQPTILARTRAAAAFVQRNHSLTRLAERLAELYQSLAEARRRTADRVASSG